MRPLHIDFETYSEADLKAVGPWAYSLHPSTEVLILAGAFDNDAPGVWLPGDPFPEWVHDLPYLGDGVDFQINAWNDFFELSIMANTLKWPIPPPRFWRDTAAEAAALALPRDLDGCCKAVGLPEELSKSAEGKALITKFSKPRKARKDGKRVLIRTRPEDDPEAFGRFIEYCKKDVIAERAVKARLKPLSASERALWELDRKINLRGVRFDVQAVQDAIAIREREKTTIIQEIAEATGGQLANIASRPQFLNYLSFQCGLDLENAQKEYLKEVLKNPALDPHAAKIIKLRLDISKSSLAKLDKLLAIICGDTAHGLLRYHGASTGRWSGNLFQPQNLPRRGLYDADGCISLFHHRDPELLEMIYGEVMETLVKCIRSMIIASPGCRLIVSDFSQIESRALAWLAGAQHKLDAYENGLDIYKVNASDAFKVPYDDITKDQRTIGKVIELACGYQGGVGAFQTFAEVYGVRIPDAEAKTHVKNWRTANPRVTSFWNNLENTAVKAVADPGTVQRLNNIAFKVVGSFLFCKLPSGRALAYHKPRLIESKFDRMQIEYMGIDAVKKKYGRQKTYGGKLAENVTSAVARDLLAHQMPRVEKKGYPIKLTVHDEVVCDVPNGHGSIEELNGIMREAPAWADGLPVDADGYESERYKK